MSSDNREAFRQTVEDWLNDERWPEPYDLSHAIVASDWFKAARAEGAAEVTERVEAAMGRRVRFTLQQKAVVRAALGAGEDLPQGERPTAQDMFSAGPAGSHRQYVEDNEADWLSDEEQTEVYKAIIRTVSRSQGRAISGPTIYEVFGAIFEDRGLLAHSAVTGQERDA